MDQKGDCCEICWELGLEQYELKQMLAEQGWQQSIISDEWYSVSEHTTADYCATYQFQYPVCILSLWKVV